MDFHTHRKTSYNLLIEGNIFIIIIWLHGYKYQKFIKLKLWKYIHIRYLFLSTIQIETRHTEIQIFFAGLLWPHSVRFCVASCSWFTLIQSETLSLGHRRKLWMSHPLATTLGYTAYVSAALLTRADQFILSNLYPPSILFSFKI